MYNSIALPSHSLGFFTVNIRYLGSRCLVIHGKIKSKSQSTNLSSTGNVGDAIVKPNHFMTTVWAKLKAARAYVNIVINDIF